MQPTVKLSLILFLLGAAHSVPIKQPDNMLDLSYAYVGNNTMPYYPDNMVFSLAVRAKKIITKGYNTWYVSKYEFETSEHGGTHYDAPVHFCNTPKCWFPEEIPVRTFLAEACVIDVRGNAAKYPNYGVTVEDLKNHEAKYGKIPDDSYVIMYSGWGKYFANKTAYKGHDTDTTKMAWPAFGPKAVKWLMDNREIKGLGVDSLSLDTGNSPVPFVHLLSLTRNKIGLENLANVDKLPSRGATIAAFPMKIKGGSGGPARIVAMWNNGNEKMACNLVALVLFTFVGMIASRFS